MKERSWPSVPPAIYLLLVSALIAQLFWHAQRPPLTMEPERMPAAPALTNARAMSLGEPVVLAKLMMLWIQGFDNQPGLSIPFRDLDYGRVIDWLTLVLRLDEQGQYPLLAASRIYAEVPDEEKQRTMLEFVMREFEKDPSRRWPWMAHAVYVAKHNVGDIGLALRVAQALARHSDNPAIPNWAKQMRIFVLEQMGKLESAKILIGGLLDSGQITDPHERWFLSNRLAELEAQLETND